MKKWTLAAIITVAAVGLTAYAAPWGPGGKGPGRDKDFRQAGGARLGFLMQHPELVEEAGITDEQVEALRQSAYDNRRQMVQLHADLQLAEIELDEAQSQDTPDAEGLNAAIEKVGLARIEIEKAQAMHKLQAREILGDEALETIRDLAQEWREERKAERRGRVEQMRRHGKSGKGRDRGGQRGGGWNHRGQGPGPFDGECPRDTEEVEFQIEE